MIIIVYLFDFFLLRVIRYLATATPTIADAAAVIYVVAASKLSTFLLSVNLFVLVSLASQ